MSTFYVQEAGVPLVSILSAILLEIKLDSLVKVIPPPLDRLVTHCG